MIKVFTDQSYAFDSNDNSNIYDKVYASDERSISAAKYGIRVFDRDVEIYSCLIIGIGGVTVVSKNSTILYNDNILICCGDSLSCLKLPQLDLLWQTKVDTAACFEVYQYENDYLTHGEVEISRVSNEGKIKWQFSGRDIFVNVDGEPEFTLGIDTISLTDFENKKYKIDFNGQVVA